MEVLAADGPALGSPLVETIVGSSLSNLKELRPPSPGRSEVRILFAFDQRRQAILLLGGDKRGAWSEWYRVAIPIAETRFRQHVLNLKDTEQ